MIGIAESSVTRNGLGFEPATMAAVTGVVSNLFSAGKASGQVVQQALFSESQRALLQERQRTTTMLLAGGVVLALVLGVVYLARK